MKKKLIVLSSSVLSFMPLMAFAQGQGNSAGCSVGATGTGTIQSIICKIGNILDTIIPILVVLGVVYFVWGVVGFVIGNDEEAKARGKDKMIYGIIGLVVIVAMWGLVGIVTKTFDLNGGANVTIPSVPF